MHLTYIFWQTWHLMDQTWYFCIGTMAWQFWYPEFLGLLVVRDLPMCCGSFPRGLLLLARTLLSPAPPPPFLPVGADHTGLEQAATWTGRWPRRLGAEWWGEGCDGPRGHARRELCDLWLRGLLARDGTLANCDFVDWRTGMPRFTETAVTCDFVDWRRRATEIPAQRKNLTRSAPNKKRSQTKIVGSTILGNVMSKMPNT